MDSGMEIPCITVDKGSIISGGTLQELLTSGIEDVFVVDVDALSRNKMNFRVYESLSKYFDLVVLNFPSRLSDFIDSFIYGANLVVIPDYIPVKMLHEFMEYSPNIVMNFGRREGVAEFIKLGGRGFLSRTPVNVENITVYYIGPGELPSSIKVRDFPLDLVAEYI
jgi:hypothetical protein